LSQVIDDSSATVALLLYCTLIIWQHVSCNATGSRTCRAVSVMEKILSLFIAARMVGPAVLGSHVLAARLAALSVEESSAAASWQVCAAVCRTYKRRRAPDLLHVAAALRTRAFSQISEPSGAMRNTPAA